MKPVAKYIENGVVIKVYPTKEAKGVKPTPYRGSSHMNTKSPTHVYWDETEKKPAVVLRKAEAV